MKPILIVDDERPIVDLIKIALRPLGAVCDAAYDGKTAADLIEKNEYDLILLDIMLPQVDGYELMEYLRPTGIPVIFLTAKSGVTDRVKGLRMGADDYIVKPFEPTELLARAEMVLRRSGRGNTAQTVWGITIHPAMRSAFEGNRAITLTPMEFSLLMMLVHNQGIALYRDILYERVWGVDAELDTRTLDLHIHRLRKKLHWEQHILTIPKIGYMLEAEV